jgi:hypothetical protein
MVSLLGIDPAGYQPSALHDPARTFRETNCYVDVWIELLNALGLEPAAAMAPACTVDFEGDQWTFFKPRSEELMRLYGIDVHEMQLYRPVVDHIVEQLQSGRTMSIELDSYYLPDTAATSYRRSHVKSTVIVEGIDPSRQLLRYFHGPGFNELTGDDYLGVFRLVPDQFTPDVLPPYVELIRFDAGQRLAGDDLRQAATESLRRELAYKPARNPWTAFGHRLRADLPCLLAGDDAAYHAYAFATVRQCGAAFEAAKSFVEFISTPPSEHASVAIQALDRQVNGAKSLLFKLARRRPFDPAPVIEQLGSDWNTAMRALDSISRASAAGAS